MKTVCVSFKGLYEANGMYLKMGGYIDSCPDDSDEWYNLMTEDDKLLAEDGEKFRINGEYGNYIVLESENEDKRVYLTKEEYDIAVL